MTSETKTPSANSGRVCQSCHKDFIIESEDFDFYKKIDVPPPTFCWRCRAIRRMSFRNIRHLYSRTCDATKKKIFTLMSPDNSMPVYDAKYWHSDQWDAMEYGQEYDFSRPFFDQIRDLYNRVPWGIMWSFDNVNSEYGQIAFSKNCYFCFDSGYDEDCAYGVTVLYSKKCLDCVNVKDGELCYYCINTNQSYKTFFSRNCTSCVDVWLSQDCVGCTNCLGCSGLRNKSYCIFNEQYDKAAYEAKFAEMRLDTWSGIQNTRAKTEKFWCNVPVKYTHSVQVSHSTGDYLYNGTELFTCFFVGTAQNMRYCQSVIYPPNRDSMDITSCDHAELTYETSCSGTALLRSVGITESEGAGESCYSINCRRVNNVFGCVALRDQQYCILNRRYSKEEYEALIPKIKKHMNDMPYVDAQGRAYRYGEFFPSDMSSFGYNQSQAFEYFPLTEEEARAQGFRWKVPEKRNYEVTKQATALPDSIEAVSDAILGEVVECAHVASGGHVAGCDADCATAFRITRQELDFYRQVKLPLPRFCFNCRHVDRLQWRNAPALYNRRCVCEGNASGVYKNVATHFHGSTSCPNSFATPYAPDRPEIVYCEQCYNAEVA